MSQAPFFRDSLMSHLVRLNCLIMNRYFALQYSANLLIELIKINMVNNEKNFVYTYTTDQLQLSQQSVDSVVAAIIVAFALR